MVLLMASCHHPLTLAEVAYSVEVTTAHHQHPGKIKFSIKYDKVPVS
jgi:hypothetical protein